MGKTTNDRVFPKILFMILQEAPDKGFADVVSWNTHGKSFKIHNRTAFLERVLVDYGIHQSHYKSLVRQLNLWGFQCVHGGRKNAERGSYYHPSFLRDEPALVDTIQRCKVKGKHVRRRSKQINNNALPAHLCLNDLARRSVPPGVDDDDDEYPLFVSSSFWDDVDVSSSPPTPKDTIVCDPSASELFACFPAKDDSQVSLTKVLSSILEAAKPQAVTSVSSSSMVSWEEYDDESFSDPKLEAMLQNWCR